jgi:hypothetical protein
MCFSAPASFAAATFLIPVGIYTVKTALQKDRHYLGLAVFPLFFGIQQAIEGGLWLAIGRADPSQSHLLALGFLFFAYFLWPFWVPFSAYFVEQNKGRRQMFVVLSVFGFLLGLSLFAPLVIYPDWLPIGLQKHSITYDTRLIWDGIVPHNPLRAVYASIVCIPLLLSSVKSVRVFGVLITLSVIIGFLFAQYAFTSVWCFMAAIVSGYILFVMRQVPAR